MPVRPRDPLAGTNSHFVIYYDTLFLFCFFFTLCFIFSLSFPSFYFHLQETSRPTAQRPDSLGRIFTRGGFEPRALPRVNVPDAGPGEPGRPRRECTDLRPGPHA